VTARMLLPYTVTSSWRDRRYAASFCTWCRVTELDLRTGPPTGAGQRSTPWNSPLVRVYSTTDLALEDRLDVGEDIRAALTPRPPTGRPEIRAPLTLGPSFIIGSCC
jgi:hypothetical protein